MRNEETKGAVTSNDSNKNLTKGQENTFKQAVKDKLEEKKKNLIVKWAMYTASTILGPTKF